MRKDIKEKIMKNKESALQCAGFLCSHPELCFEEFSEWFTRYLCDKFLLTPEELVTDNFYEICQLSAEKAAHLPKGLLDASELASKCGGATTAMNKKVLFLLAVNREYGITITAEEGVQIETFTELQKMVYAKLRADNGRTGF